MPYSNFDNLLWTLKKNERLMFSH